MERRPSCLVGTPTSFDCGFGIAVEGDGGDNENHANDLCDGRDLSEHDDADDGGGRRQERDHEGVGGPGQPSHGKLVEYVRNHRGRNADTYRCTEGDGISEA